MTGVTSGNSRSLHCATFLCQYQKQKRQTDHCTIKLNVYVAQQPPCLFRQPGDNYVLVQIILVMESLLNLLPSSLHISVRRVTELQRKLLCLCLSFVLVLLQVHRSGGIEGRLAEETHTRAKNVIPVYLSENSIFDVYLFSVKGITFFSCFHKICKQM